MSFKNLSQQSTFIPQELIYNSGNFCNYHIPLQFENEPQQLIVSLVLLQTFFRTLKKVEIVKDYTDCCLMIDGMAIK